MITAIDTSVLLDVLLQDPSFAAKSEEVLRRASKDGALIIAEVVYAELAGLFPNQTALDTFLQNTGIQMKSSNPAILWKAGELWRRFCADRLRHAAIARRIIADFLIGAHAMVHAEQLLTRDRDFYPKVFAGLRIVHP